MKKESLVVSVSGGQTSMMMAAVLKQDYSSRYDITCIFANTGCENEETLQFVDRCDRHFDLGVVWVEAVINPIHMKGVTHRVTNFNDAYRNHQYKDPLHPFHAHIAKSGIPNRNKPQCSDRLKAFAIEHYKKMNGLAGSRHAIGIRSDEKGRVMGHVVRGALESMSIVPCEWRVQSFDKRQIDINLAKEVYGPADRKLIDSIDRYSNKLRTYGLVYPMCDWFETDKIDVNNFWEDQPFRLELEDHEGNCQTCWKKSDKKLALIAIENPERFEAFNYWEGEYEGVKPNANGTRRVFFRGNKSAEQVIFTSKIHSAARLRRMIGADVSDENSGCSESCESYDII